MKLINEFVLSAFADEIDSDLKTQFDGIKKLGIDHIEVRGVNGKGLTEYTIPEVKEIAKQFECEGVGVSAIASPFGKIQITDDFAPHLEDVKKGMEIANIMGTKRVRLFSFYMPKDETDFSKYKNEVMDRMGAMAEECKKAGILCCHENEKGIYGDTPERCIEILDNVDGIVQIFDPANFVQCGVDTIEAWKMLKNSVNYLHIKDSKKDCTIVPTGLGVGNVSYIVKEYLNSDVSEKIITMEPHLWVFDGLDKLESGEKLHHELSFDSAFDAFETAVKAFRNTLN